MEEKVGGKLRSGKTVCIGVHTRVTNYGSTNFI